MKKLNVHFVGIKGVGMTPLAVIAKEAGFVVTGSDVESEFITDSILKKAKIVPLVGFKKEHIKNQDLVIITGAHGGYDNPEALEAKEKKLKAITQGEAVGLFMEGGIFGKKLTGISVAGTHGKTTTTAMLATVFKESNLDPTYVIGTGDIGSLGLPGHFGKGNYFISEADEYATEPKYNKKSKFLWQKPKIAIVTNIEFDHPDIFESIVDVRNSFLDFFNQLSPKSLLIVCGDDPEIRTILKDVRCTTVTYGFNHNNDYILENFHVSGDHTFYRLDSKGTVISDIMLQVSGQHNALNSSAAIIASLECGLPIEKIKKGLLAFKGSKRRLEYIGELSSGARVYDDYAHHPTEIKTTLNALRLQYPNKKIVAIFQPHTFSRTKKLFDQFILSFVDTDQVLLTDIYPSLREIEDPTISSSILFESMKERYRDIQYLPTLEDVVKYINEKRFRSDTVIVTMGAGDIYNIHSELTFQ